MPNFILIHIQLFGHDTPTSHADRLTDSIGQRSDIAADTLRDLVTLTFDLLTLVSGHTWRVTWSTPPPSLKILRLSILELCVLTSPIGYH